MDVKQMRLMDFFENPALKLDIPPYQRVYSWTPRQCSELWLDVNRAARDERDHFSGIVILTREEDLGEGVERLSVVDGQQRITTITLLLEALARYADSHEMSGGIPTPADIRSMLFLDDAAGEGVRKLTLSRDDDATLEAVLLATCERKPPQLSTDNALFSSTTRESWLENARYRRFEPRKPPTTALSHPLFPGNRR
ncbi:DUF262 domain-containing protein [Adlercreutzia sp. ZJ473]|uniref:DUF262 domain-containing protein n=1 Tax=Adlercreutzia sp. ZJ473 TaxID=2722822 RepID=UPI001553291F|nr:DUF262 domain-containing protein [Adlercreutzia sp. ZJ473]